VNSCWITWLQAYLGRKVVFGAVPVNYVSTPPWPPPWTVWLMDVPPVASQSHVVFPAYAGWRELQFVLLLHPVGTTQLHVPQQDIDEQHFAGVPLTPLFATHPPVDVQLGEQPGGPDELGASAKHVAAQ